MNPSTVDGLDLEQKEDAQAAAEAWLGELVVLSFRENKRGGDPIAHTADGRAVFPDKFQGGDDIEPGQHWVCSVSQKGESTFFASPVARLDASYFAKLVPQERQRLARVVVEEYQDALEHEIRETLGDDAGSGGSPPSNLEQERDELHSRLMELNEQYDETVTRLAEAEAHLESLEQQVHADGAKRGSNDVEGESDLSKHPRHHNGREPPVRFPVTREAGDVLVCEGFTDGLYHGHVSPNRRTLFFKSYGRGPLPCQDGRIEVPGLREILGEHVDGLEARFDPRHGGFFVEIPRQ